MPQSLSRILTHPPTDHTAEHLPRQQGLSFLQSHVVFLLIVAFKDVVDLTEYFPERLGITVHEIGVVRRINRRKQKDCPESRTCSGSRPDRRSHRSRDPARDSRCHSRSSCGRPFARAAAPSARATHQPLQPVAHSEQQFLKLPRFHVEIDPFRIHLHSIDVIGVCPILRNSWRGPTPRSHSAVR